MCEHRYFVLAARSIVVLHISVAVLHMMSTVIFCCLPSALYSCYKADLGREGFIPLDKSTLSANAAWFVM